MDEQAKKVIDIIIDNEGGYVWDFSDSGGETAYGISSRAYPDLIISKLTKQDAEDIYFADYYSKLNGQKLEFDVILSLCDFGVNAGIKTSARVLQLVINRMGNFNLDTDGKIGNKTLEALKTIRHMGATNYMLLRFTDMKKRFYLGISGGKNLKFLRGWLNRTDKIQDIIDAGT